MVLLSLYFGFTSTGVDNAAHVAADLWISDSRAFVSRKERA